MDWDSDYIRNFVEMALKQDRAVNKSAAALLLSAPLVVRAQIVAATDCVCAGLPFIERVFRVLDSGMQISLMAQDGQEVRRDETVIELRGDAGAILTGECTALNVLEHLSGITMKVRRFAEEIRGTRAKICGPFEATPGMRRLEEYAVELGGGRVHSANGVLLTTNHVQLAGGVKAALDQAHSLVALQLRPRAMTAYEAVGVQPNMAEADVVSVQVEVQDKDELREALEAGAEFVILKDVGLEDARRFVQVVREMRPEVTVQISGEITIANVRAYAETGADFLCLEELMQPTPGTRFNLLVERREEK